jgi:hypothetical protein
VERLEQEVRGTLARFGPAAGMAEIVAAWPSAVGEAVARHAWPARIGRDGTLHVATSSSAWALELTLLEKTVLERLTDALTDETPRRLRFAPGPLPEPSPPGEDAAPRRRVVPGTGERERAGVIAAGIEDENLRKLVADAVAVSLARAASDRGV